MDQPSTPTPGAVPPSPPSAGAGAASTPPPYAPPSAQQRYAEYQAQQAASRTSDAAGRDRRMGTGWKVLIAFLALATLGACSLCGISAIWLGGAEVPTGDAIALIHVDGVISGTGSVLDGVVTPEYMLDLLAAAEDDPSVKAVLLRIDSPGGTVAASEEISTEIARMDKPVVASIGDVGASGAYMIASQCDEIVASRTSMVGSIGVISEVMNIEGLLDKIGVDFTVLTAGEYKDAGSPYRSMTATETALIEHQIDIAYQEFIDIVAEGRGLERSEVEELATGWVWSGVEAREVGLVDSLGTFNDALDRAADLGGIEGDPYIVTYDDYDTLDLIYGLLGFEMPFAPARALDGETILRRSLPR